MNQLKLEKHSGRKRSILLIIKLLIILVSVLGCAKNETYKENIVPDISVNDINYEKSRFLEKYNLPIYFAEYTFDQDKLSKIYFGFEYP